MAEGGVSGLARGWAPTAIGYSMQGACKFGFYELFKNVYGKAIGEEAAYQNQVMLYLAASASAEFFADIALCPMEAVKVCSRYESMIITSHIILTLLFRSESRHQTMLQPFVNAFQK